VATSLSHTSYFCNQSGDWEKTRQNGDKCNESFEFAAVICKDAPGCHPGDYRTICLNNTCMTKETPDPCLAKGIIRIITKQDADISGDETCIESLAQREIMTICAPCREVSVIRLLNRYTTALLIVILHGMGFCNTGGNLHSKFLRRALPSGYAKNSLN